MTVWAQQNKVCFIVVIGITIHVLYLKWGLVCTWIYFTPAAPGAFVIVFFAYITDNMG